MATPKTNPEIARLEAELRRVRETLASLIAWMVQSSVSPINQSEATQLLRRLDGEDV